MTPQTVPPLAERQKPGLSETLPAVVDAITCQACGSDKAITRWQECDEWDKTTMRVVPLCEPCGKRLIGPHARLYISLFKNWPLPGSMAICDDCGERDGVTCRSPLARHNGGPGMVITIEPPLEAFVCPGGLTRIYNSPAKSCSGKPTHVAFAGTDSQTQGG